MLEGAEGRMNEPEIERQQLPTLDGVGEKEHGVITQHWLQVPGEGEEGRLINFSREYGWLLPKFD